MRNQPHLHKSNKLGSMDASRSLNQLSSKKPLILPNIKKRRNIAYDSISVSPQHIRFSSVDKQIQKGSENGQEKYLTNRVSLPYVPTLPTTRNYKPTEQRNLSPKQQKYKQRHNSVDNQRQHVSKNSNRNSNNYTKANNSVRYEYDFDKILRSGIFDEDRVFQKQNEYEQEYRKLRNRLKWKAQQKRIRKGDLSMIYDKFIKLI